MIANTAATTALSTLSRCAARNSSAAIVATTTAPLASSSTRYFSDKPKIAQQKGGNKKKSKKGSNTPNEPSSKHDRVTQILIQAYDAQPMKPPPASPEEMARRAEIGRNYVIGKFKRHNKLQHDLACKIKMKNHAIRMLPRDTMWKEEALKVDVTGEGMVPKWRRIPVDTPPIPDFDISKFIVRDEDA